MSGLDLRNPWYALRVLWVLRSFSDLALEATVSTSTMLKPETCKYVEDIQFARLFAAVTV